MIFSYGNPSYISKNDWQASKPCKFTHGNRKHIYRFDQLDNLMMGNYSPKPFGPNKKHFSAKETINKDQILKPQKKLFISKLNHSNVDLTFSEVCPSNMNRSCIERQPRNRNYRSPIHKIAEMDLKMNRSIDPNLNSLSNSYLD